MGQFNRFEIGVTWPVRTCRGREGFEKVWDTAGHGLHLSESRGVNPGPRRGTVVGPMMGAKGGGPTARPREMYLTLLRSPVPVLFPFPASFPTLELKRAVCRPCWAATGNHSIPTTTSFYATASEVFLKDCVELTLNVLF